MFLLAYTFSSRKYAFCHILVFLRCMTYALSDLVLQRLIEGRIMSLSQDFKENFQYLVKDRDCQIGFYLKLNKKLVVLQKGYTTAIQQCRGRFNHFLADVSFLYPLKIPIKQRFSSVFRGYQMGTVARNPLSETKYISFAQFRICSLAIDLVVMYYGVHS